MVLRILRSVKKLKDQKTVRKEIYLWFNIESKQTSSSAVVR